MLQPWFLWADDVYDHIPKRFDVLALQEVWTTEARDAILAHVGNHYPYHHWPQEYNELVGCDMTNPTVQYVAPNYIGCLQLYGIDTQTVQQPLKAVDVSCNQLVIGLAVSEPFTPLNQLCAACLINSMEYLPQGDAAFAAIDICGRSQGPKYGHKGVNGQLILSKHPIEDVEETRFNGFVVNRVNVHATIAGIRFGFGHFAFNLLEDALPVLAPYMYGALQTDQAKDFADKGVDVIVGDMNSGPGYQPAGYESLFALGYSQASTNQATWCDEVHADWLPCVNAASTPLSIDHIFVRNSSKVVSWGASTFNEHPIMSDHIGVSAHLYNCWWCFWF